MGGRGGGGGGGGGCWGGGGGLWGGGGGGGGGLTLDSTTAVVFHNRKKDTLVLYTLDRDGDRCITKKLERGAFLLPVPAEGEKYVVLAASKVASLFRA